MGGRVRAHGARRSGDEGPPVWLGDVSRAEGPLHAQIGEVIEQAICAGHLQPGDRLPPERELAGWFGVNRLTLRQALSGLEQGRRIRRAVGRQGGTFVAEPTVERDLSSFAGFSEQVRRLGLTASALVLKARATPAPGPVARSLELKEGDTVFEVGRLRLANARPVLLESSSFPAERFPGFWESPSEVPSTSCWPNATMPVRAEPLKSSSRSGRTTMPPRCSGSPGARRCCLSSASPSTLTTGRSSSRETCSGATAPVWSCGASTSPSSEVVSSAGPKGSGELVGRQGLRRDLDGAGFGGDVDLDVLSRFEQAVVDHADDQDERQHCVEDRDLVEEMQTEAE